MAKALSPDVRERLGRELGKAFTDAWGASSEMREKVRVWRDQYEGVLAEKSQRWSSNVNIPSTKAHVNAAAIRVAGVIFAADPIFEVESLDPAWQEVQQYEENYLQFWNEQTRLAAKGTLAILDALITGQAWLRPGIKMTGKPAPDVTTSLLSGSPLKVSDLDVVPTCDYVITEDMLLLPYTAPSFERAKGAFGRLTLRYNDLVAAKNGLYSDAVDRLKNRWQEERGVSQTHEQQGIEQVVPENIWSAEWECWEGIYRYAAGGDKAEVEYLILCAWNHDSEGEAIVLRAAPFREVFGDDALWPYIPIIYDPKPNSLWGGSMCEDLRGLQNWENALFNACTDSLQMALLPPLVVNPSIANNKNLKWGPLERWPAANPTDVTPIGIAPSAIAAVQAGMGMMEIVRNVRERVTGQTDIAIGKTSQDKKTAFEIGAVVEAGNELVNHHVGTLQIGIDEHTGLQAYAQSLMGMIKRFMPKVPLLYKDRRGGRTPFVEVDPAWHEGSYEFIPHGSHGASNPEVRFKKAMGLKQSLAASPFSAISPMDTPESLIDKVGRYYRAESRFIQAMGEKNPESWLGGEPTTAEEALSIAMVINPAAATAIMARAQAESQPAPVGLVPPDSGVGGVPPDSGFGGGFGGLGASGGGGGIPAPPGYPGMAAV